MAAMTTGTIMDIITGTIEMPAVDVAGELTTLSLLRLMAWMSPAFPLGGFAWSGGLERAVEDRLVNNPADLQKWLKLSLKCGALHNDAILLAASWRANGSAAELRAIAELAAALAPSAERFQETVSLGAAYLEAMRAWPHPVLEKVPPCTPFPVAVGGVAGAHMIAVESVIAAWLHSAVSQSVSAAIRLGVSGQQAGVRVLAALEQTICEVVAIAAGSTLDDLGSSTIAADTASLRHETQSVRLFRS